MTPSSATQDMDRQRSRRSANIVEDHACVRLADASRFTKRGKGGLLHAL